MSEPFFTPKKPAWFVNWLALHGFEARFSKPESLWIIEKDGKSEGCSCLLNESRKDFLAHISRVRGDL